MTGPLTIVFWGNRVLPYEDVIQSHRKQWGTRGRGRLLSHGLGRGELSGGGALQHQTRNFSLWISASGTRLTGGSVFCTLDETFNHERQYLRSYAKEAHFIFRAYMLKNRTFTSVNI